MKDHVERISTREAILDATDILLGRYGYNKMTIDDLAKEVGIGKGSIYLHFDSKEEIALSHVDRIVDRLKNRLENIAAQEDCCSEKLERMMVERVVFRFDSVQHYTQSLNELLSRLRSKLLERRKRYFEEESRLFKTVIDEGISTGEFRKQDSLKAAQTVLIATNSLLPYSLSTNELGKRSEIAAKASAVAQMLMTGLVDTKMSTRNKGVPKK